MNTHYYSLQPGPFSLIKTGQKTVEMRLYDDRRKLLQVGDMIVFTNTESKEEQSVIVTALAVFEDFSLLYQRFSKEELGYLHDEVANASDMEHYYSKAMIKKHGVLAISIHRIGT